MELCSTYCSSELCRGINEYQLKPMYEAWKSELEKNRDEYEKNDDFKKLNSLRLLACSDTYLERENKIMLIGREEHCDKGSWCDAFSEKSYLTEAYYDYEKEIIFGRAKNTNYLKTRRLLSSIDDFCEKLKGTFDDGARIMSLLSNNLNKTSIDGTKTSSNDYKIFYKPFIYNGLQANVFIHELNILKPDTIVILCGKGYDGHIKRAFGEKFFEYIKEEINDINIFRKPLSNVINIDVECVKKWYNIDGYSFKIMFGLHPSARMKKDIRELYYKNLQSIL